jgi:DNA repair protein RecO (recombination protein O)
MLHSTKAIVLRTVKYGETSLVATLYTELFGVQAYLINGVRTDKKSGTKANLFQPGTLLDTIVYHHPSKNLQRIKEVRIATIYQSIHRQIIKNAIAIYVVELISKTITEPECNPELYHFFRARLAHHRCLARSQYCQFSIAVYLRAGFSIGLCDTAPKPSLTNTF